MGLMTCEDIISFLNRINLNIVDSWFKNMITMRHILF